MPSRCLEILQQSRLSTPITPSPLDRFHVKLGLKHRLIFVLEVIVGLWGTQRDHSGDCWNWPRLRHWLFSHCQQVLIVIASFDCCCESVLVFKVAS